MIRTLQSSRTPRILGPRGIVGLQAPFVSVANLADGAIPQKVAAIQPNRPAAQFSHHADVLACRVWAAWGFRRSADCVWRLFPPAALECVSGACVFAWRVKPLLPGPPRGLDLQAEGFAPHPATNRHFDLK